MANWRIVETQGFSSLCVTRIQGFLHFRNGRLIDWKALNSPSGFWELLQLRRLLRTVSALAEVDARCGHSDLAKARQILSPTDVELEPKEIANCC